MKNSRTIMKKSLKRGESVIAHLGVEGAGTRSKLGE
jgi:hypothetical protein